MANSNLIISIIARDAASPNIKNVQKSLGGVSKEADRQDTKLRGLNQRLLAFSGLALGAGVGLGRYKTAVGTAIDASTKYQNAMAGLNTIARHFKVDQNKATEAAKNLASDGLMTVTESAKGLKNLLSSGFSLPQAIKLMERFKDSASFNRQASLGFGEAISGATEGIKNGNSILVDNAGVTKNLSRILEEAGYSAQDLNKATSDNNIRQALYNGLLKETNPMVGDAKTLAKQFAGEQAKLGAETDKTQQAIGTALQPALRDLMGSIRPIITATGEWVRKNPELASNLILVTGAVLGGLTAIGLLGLAVSGLSTAFTVLGIKAVASATLTAAIWVAKATWMAGVWVAKSVLMASVWAAQMLIVKGSAVAGAAVAAAAGRSAGAGWVDGANRGKNAFAIMKALVRSPIVMPAIIVAAAIAAVQGVIWILDDMRKKAMAEEQRFRDYQRREKSPWANVRNSDGSRTKVGKFATGTSHAPGGMAWVGERGPELVNLPRGSKVFPNAVSREMAGGGGQSISVVQNITNQVDLRNSMNEIGWLLRTAG